MEIFQDPLQFQAWCASVDGERALGFVPTMGALHEGHLSLVQASLRRDAVTAVSIFVNPTQFGPSEDFDRYPRMLAQDCALLEDAGVALVFAPAAETMYGPGDATRVEVSGLESRLDGGSRPGHFRGVATVVLKLLQLAAPTRAYFGQKDAAQVAVIQRLVRDLFLPVEIVVCPTVREPDGVAMSSRNAMLSPAGRAAARALPLALRRMGEEYEAGERSTAALVALGTAAIAAEPGLRLDFLQAVDAETLLPVEFAAPGTLFALAAFAGAVRLIDNARVDADAAWRL
ncbi:MAG TPA: pantoate--beta-alanine ligase [Terriglobales bacterium]|nr:pantoate--beta-alanine ligase [Terriglobales bacterium]